MVQLVRDLEPNGTVLHVAADAALGPAAGRVVTLDLNAHADVRADLTSMPFRDRSFSLSVCSHVLEHVPNDRAALEELRRVTAGPVVVAVPVDLNLDQTIEDPSVTSDEERQRLYGHWDHVRCYGRDVVDRMGELEWNVTVRSDPASPHELTFVCT